MMMMMERLQGDSDGLYDADDQMLELELRLTCRLAWFPAMMKCVFLCRCQA